MRELGPSAAASARTGRDEIPLARSADIARRRKVYIIQMSIRMVCFLLLFVVPGWWKLAVLVGAVILPFVAVMMANDADVGDPRARTAAEEVPAPGRHRIVTVEDDGTVNVRDDDEDPGPRASGGAR